jgi:hypothetical protein
MSAMHSGDARTQALSAAADPAQQQLQNSYSISTHKSGLDPTLSGAPLAPSGIDLLRGVAPPQAADEIGRLGGFRLLRLLGEGGMGAVLLAEDMQLQRLVAIKLLRPTLASDPSAAERFLREARAAAAVKHDHVVTIYQVGEADGVPFLAQELLEGETLEQRLGREPVLPVAEVVRIGREIAAGLGAAHDRGLLHRDIKPANIWLESPQGRVKILDFGLARFQEDQVGITTSGMIVGTPAYMSPEQASGQPLDVHSDLFSLGCVLYRMASGRLPFQGRSVLEVLKALATETPPHASQLNRAVPPALDAIIDTLLHKRPNDRLATAAELGTRLAMVLEAGRSSPAPHNRAWRLSVGVIAVALGMALVAGMIWFGAHGLGGSQLAQPTAGSVPRAAAVPEGTPLPALESRAQPQTAANTEVRFAKWVGRSNRFEREPNGDWYERDNANGIALFREQSCTSGLVELHDAERKIDVRLSATHMYIKTANDKEFRPFRPGQWEVVPEGVSDQPAARWEGAGDVHLDCDSQSIWTEYQKGVPTFGYRETARTADYVELHDAGRGLSLRLMASVAQVKSSSQIEFSEARAGGWKIPPVLPSAIAPASPSPLPASAGRFALRFDGVDDGVQIPSLSYDGSPCTIEFWLRCEEHKLSVPVSLSGPKYRLSFFHQPNKSGLATGSDQGGSYATDPNPLPNAWVHLAGTFTGAKAEYFINGNRFPENERYNNRSPGIGLYLGWQLDSKQWGYGGKIDELRVSRGIRYDANFKPAARFEADEATLALYHFDEGTGEVLVDSSPHKHHGKVVGATWVTSELDDDPSSILKVAISDATPSGVDGKWVGGGGGWIQLEKSGDWREFDRLGKLIAEYTEAKRTGDFVQLLNKRSGRSTRLSPTHLCMLLDDGKYGPIMPGKWESIPEGTVFVPRAKWISDSGKREFACDSERTWTEYRGGVATGGYFEIERTAEHIDILDTGHGIFVRLSGSLTRSKPAKGEKFTGEEQGHWQTAPDPTEPEPEGWRGQPNLSTAYVAPR